MCGRPCTFALVGRGRGGRGVAPAIHARVLEARRNSEASLPLLSGKNARPNPGGPKSSVVPRRIATKLIAGCMRAVTSSAHRSPAPCACGPLGGSTSTTCCSSSDKQRNAHCLHNPCRLSIRRGPSEAPREPNIVCHKRRRHDSAQSPSRYASLHRKFCQSAHLIFAASDRATTAHSPGLRELQAT